MTDFEEVYDPWQEKNVPVRDIRAEVAEISAANPASSESVAAFLDHRRHLVLDVDITGEDYRVSAMVPPPRGIGVGVYFKQKIIGFDKTTAMYWWIVAPEFLGGPSHSLVYLTSSNQAVKGCEALVEYFDQKPAVFRIWDWSTPPKPDGSRFVVDIPFAQWGAHYLPVTIDQRPYHALYVMNRTMLRPDPNKWTNDVFVYDSSASTFDHTWGHDYYWIHDPIDYFGWGPIVEPFQPYDFQTTNPVGYAKARLLTDRVDAILMPQNSIFLQRNVGFEPFYVQPNHTMLAT